MFLMKVGKYYKIYEKKAGKLKFVKHLGTPEKILKTFEKAEKVG